MLAASFSRAGHRKERRSSQPGPIAQASHQPARLNKEIHIFLQCGEPRAAQALGGFDPLIVTWRGPGSSTMQVGHAALIPSCLRGGGLADTWSRIRAGG